MTCISWLKDCAVVPSELPDVLEPEDVPVVVLPWDCMEARSWSNNWPGSAVVVEDDADADVLDEEDDTPSIWSSSWPGSVVDAEADVPVADADELGGGGGGGGGIMAWSLDVRPPAVPSPVWAMPWSMLVNSLSTWDTVELPSLDVAEVVDEVLWPVEPLLASSWSSSWPGVVVVVDDPLEPLALLSVESNWSSSWPGSVLEDDVDVDVDADVVEEETPSS